MKTVIVPKFLQKIEPAMFALQSKHPLTPDRTLRIIYWLRTISIFLQGSALLIVPWLTGIELPLSPLLAAVLFLCLFHIAVYRRLGRETLAGGSEVALHLGVDIAQFTFVLYWVGGAGNPFVSWYLLPVALAAAALPIRWAWPVAGLAAAAYSALLFWYRPLAGGGRGLQADHLGPHVYGMWMNFLLAAVLIVFFVGLLSRQVRERERAMARAREVAIRDAALVNLGVLAAGAAHRMATPLSTLKLQLEELAERIAETAEQHLIQQMKRQTQICQASLEYLIADSRELRGEAGRETGLAQYLKNTFASWKMTRPEIDVTCDIPAALDCWTVSYDAALHQALVNLLDNAADASLAAGDVKVGMSATVNDEKIEIDIHDTGPGFNRQRMEKVQAIGHSSKPHGLGIGLALTKSTVERLAGSLQSRQTADGHKIRLVIPLVSLRPVNS